MTTDAQKRAAAKYDAANTVQLKLKLNLLTDQDILSRLDTLDEPKQAYIKRLIRQDIRNQE